MTVSVKQALDKICNDNIFSDELYFTGGTALAFYLNHRVSEDIDIVSSKALPYKKIIPSITKLGATKLQDENVTALRMAGLFPDEYMIKFILDVKSVAKLKIVALIMRDKSRDLFDFGNILDNKVLSEEEIVNLFSKIRNDIQTITDIINFIKSKKEPIDDEAVYLSENDRIDLSFEEIKEQVVLSLENSL